MLEFVVVIVQNSGLAHGIGLPSLAREPLDPILYYYYYYYYLFSPFILLLMQNYDYNSFQVFKLYASLKLI